MTLHSQPPPVGPRIDPLPKRLRLITVVGLIIGAAGISLLWAGGQDFPVYPPPGIVILAVGALFVIVAPWRWVPGVGAFLGLFVIVGFAIEAIVSGGGIDNLAGDEGGLRLLGQIVQLLGVATALLAGSAAVVRAKRAAPGA